MVKLTCLSVLVDFPCLKSFNWCFLYRPVSKPTSRDLQATRSWSALGANSKNSKRISVLSQDLSQFAKVGRSSRTLLNKLGIWEPSEFRAERSSLKSVGQDLPDYMKAIIETLHHLISTKLRTIEAHLMLIQSRRRVGQWHLWLNRKSRSELKKFYPCQLRHRKKSWRISTKLW